MEHGENFSEACVREVQEETGIEVHINNLVGVYTSPHVLLEYSTENRF